MRMKYTPDEHGKTRSEIVQAGVGMQSVYSLAAAIWRMIKRSYAAQD